MLYLLPTVFHYLHISFKFLWAGVLLYFCLFSREITECYTRNRYLINDTKFNLCPPPHIKTSGSCHKYQIFVSALCLLCTNYKTEIQIIIENTFTLQYPLITLFHPVIEQWISYGWYLINNLWSCDIKILETLTLYVNKFQHWVILKKQS